MVLQTEYMLDGYAIRHIIVGMQKKCMERSFLILQSQQEIVRINGSNATASFPVTGAYNLIFLTAALLSVSSIVFAIMAGKHTDKTRLPISTERP